MRYFPFLLLVIFFNSCASELDFNQVEETELTQVLTVSSFYYNVNQRGFLNDTGTVENLSVSNESKFDIFSVNYIDKNIIKLEYDLKYENTFNRDFNIIFDFLDVNDTPVQSRTIIAAKNNISKERFIFQGADLEALKATFKIRVTMNLASSSTLLDINDEVKLSLKSAVIATFKIEQ